MIFQRFLEVFRQAVRWI